MAKKSSGFKKVVIVFLLISLGGGIGMGYHYYNILYKPNVNLEGRKNKYIYIKHDAGFEDVLTELRNRKILINEVTFISMAEMKKYPQAIIPGKYLVLKEMNNKALINMLISGLQQKVEVSFSNIRTKEQLAGRISNEIEPDSVAIMDFLNDEEACKKYGFNTETIVTMFIAGDYKFDSWAMTSDDFFDRIAKEYKGFWTPERKQKAAALNMTQTEVSILSSIVQQEQQSKLDERPLIAGVYLNRLKEGMKLQADPTVIFACGDFSIKRVNYQHLKTESRYNTYVYEGLPPGPICVPSPNGIDAVLNAPKHDYIFFCAKPNLNGYHDFAATYPAHQIFAKKYQNALNKLGIK